MSETNTDRARDNCRHGEHSDPGNYGMCIYCMIIIDPEPDEDPNSYRRSNGWPDLPLWPTDNGR